MSWRDELLPASFRGVACFYADVSQEGGRRLAVHEYPLRDDPYPEDMGRKARGFRVSCYLLGADYLTQKEALITALEAQGPGTFVHPFKGPLSVACDTYRVRETNQEGGYCEFEIDFVGAGKPPSPTSVAATADKAVTKAQSAMGTLQTVFAAIHDVAAFPARLATEAQTLVDQLYDDLSPLLGAVNELEADANAFLSGLQEIKLTVLEPVSLATSIGDFFQRFADDVAAFIPSFDETTSSRGATIPADPSYGMAALTDWGSALPPVIGDIPVTAQQQANQDALVALVQGMAVCCLAQIYAATTFTSLTDAGAARDQIVDAIDTVALAAADAGHNDVYQALTALEQAVVQDLTVRGKQLPDVVTITVGGVLPALVLAQRLYGDASRAAELVSRNDAPNPLFMPTEIEALTS